MRWGLVVGCLASGACSLAAREAARSPLQDDGEVALSLSALPEASRGVSLEVRAAYAVRNDGSWTPLEVSLREISWQHVQRERLLARGALAPGAWRGFALQIARPSAAGSEVLAEPVRIDAPFFIAARKGVVMTARLASGAGPQGTVAPAFTASEPHLPVPQVLALCSNGASNDVTLFDKRTRTAGALLPSGRDPAGIALDPANSRIYVALEGDHAISVLDTATLAELGRIRLNPGDEPRDLALTADGRTLLTANAGSNTVSYVDTGAMTETARVLVGEEPSWILLDRRGARAFVSNLRGNSISVLDVSSRVVVTTLATDEQPLRAQVNRAGTRLYVVHRASPFLVVFALPALTPVNRVYVGSSIAFLKLDAATDLLYLSRRDEGRIRIYDGFGLLPVDAIDAPGAASYMAIADAENVLFLVLAAERQVAAVELTSKRLLGAVDVGDEPRQVAVAGERY